MSPTEAIIAYMNLEADVQSAIKERDRIGAALRPETLAALRAEIDRSRLEAAPAPANPKPDIDWASVDWTQRTRAIAKALNVPDYVVSKMRGRHALATLGRSRRRSAR